MFVLRPVGFEPTTINMKVERCVSCKAIFPENRRFCGNLSLKTLQQLHNHYKTWNLRCHCFEQSLLVRALSLKAVFETYTLLFLLVKGTQPDWYQTDFWMWCRAQVSNTAPYRVFSETLYLQKYRLLCTKRKKLPLPEPYRHLSMHTALQKATNVVFRESINPVMPFLL